MEIGSLICDCFPYEVCRICISPKEYERIKAANEKCIRIAENKGFVIAEVPYANTETIGE